MVTFKSLDVGSSYLHIRYISKEYGSSSYMKIVVSSSPWSTQPGHPFVGRRNEYQPLWLGSKGRHGSCGWQVKLCDPIVTHGLYQAINQSTGLFVWQLKCWIECWIVSECFRDEGLIIRHYIHCVHKKTPPPFYFSNNSVKN